MTKRWSGCDAARRSAVAAGHSPGSMLVSELELRLVRRIEDKTEELVDEMNTRYIGEPEVAARMARITEALGLQFDDVESESGPVELASAPLEGPELVESTAAAPNIETAARGKLWLPGDPLAHRPRRLGNRGVSIRFRRGVVHVVAKYVVRFGSMRSLGVMTSRAKDDFCAATR